MYIFFFFGHLYPTPKKKLCQLRAEGKQIQQLLINESSSHLTFKELVN